MWRNKVLQRRFRKMKCVIDFNRTYNPFNLADCLIVASGEFIKQGLKRMPSNTIQDIVRRGIFCHDVRFFRQMLCGEGENVMWTNGGK